jgi:hypothetical protein
MSRRLKIWVLKETHRSPVLSLRIIQIAAKVGAIIPGIRNKINDISPAGCLLTIAEIIQKKYEAM